LEIFRAPEAASEDTEQAQRTDPANDELAADPGSDRWCWPHSDAMNTTEIERFLARVKYFIEHGIAEDAAERMADELVLADRRSSSSTAPALPTWPVAWSCRACARLSKRGTYREQVAAGKLAAGVMCGKQRLLCERCVGPPLLMSDNFPDQVSR